MEDKVVVERILGKYNLSYSRILSPQKGYRNQSWPIILSNDEVVNVIIFKCEPSILNRIKQADAVSNYLASTGYPARHSHIHRIIQIKTRDHLAYAGIYNYLPGQTIPWESYRMSHVKLLGQAMSDMHFRLSAFEAPAGHKEVTKEYHNIHKRMKCYFEDDQVRQALKSKVGLTMDMLAINRLNDVLTIASHLPAKQALHMDFVRGNILFDTKDTSADSSYSYNESRLSGVIDFEKTAYGHVVFDIARTLAFLMVDCKYISEKKIKKYFLKSGYCKRGQSVFKNPIVRTNDSGLNMLEELINLFLVYDFYKFLRHNPYEYLYQNEHFVRTKAVLENRGFVVAV